MNKQIRESDGRFALTLATEAACQRDMRRELAKARRAQQIEEENAEWAEQHGIDQSELRFLFA